MFSQHRTFPRQPDNSPGSRVESGLDYIYQNETADITEGQIPKSHQSIDPGGSVLGGRTATGRHFKQEECVCQWRRRWKDVLVPFYNGAE